jgi:hypothetical protein
MMNIFVYLTVLRGIEYLYCTCNTDSVRWEAFLRSTLILLRKFSVSSTARNLFNFYVSEVVRKGPTNKHSLKQGGLANAS